MCAGVSYFHECGESVESVSLSVDLLYLGAGKPRAAKQNELSVYITEWGQEFSSKDNFQLYDSDLMND